MNGLPRPPDDNIGEGVQQAHANLLHVTLQAHVEPVKAIADSQTVDRNLSGHIGSSPKSPRRSPRPSLKKFHGSPSSATTAPLTPDRLASLDNVPGSELAIDSAETHTVRPSIRFRLQKPVARVTEHESSRQSNALATDAGADADATAADADDADTDSASTSFDSQDKIVQQSSRPHTSVSRSTPDHMDHVIDHAMRAESLLSPERKVVPLDGERVFIPLSVLQQEAKAHPIQTAAQTQKNPLSTITGPGALRSLFDAANQQRRQAEQAQQAQYTQLSYPHAQAPYAQALLGQPNQTPQMQYQMQYPMRAGYPMPGYCEFAQPVHAPHPAHPTAWPKHHDQHQLGLKQEPQTDEKPNIKNEPSEPEGEDVVDQGLIRCICGIDDDDGFTIQCDTCLVWQHALCMQVSLEDVPEVYYCEKCAPRAVDPEAAQILQTTRMEEEMEQERLAALNPNAEGKVKVRRGRRQVSGDPETPGSLPTKRKPSGAKRSLSDKLLNAPSSSSNAEASSANYFSVCKEFIPESQRDHPWECEFTPIEQDIIHDASVQKRLQDYLAAQLLAERPNLDQEDLLSPVGRECLPVDLAGLSMTSLSAQTSIRAIPGIEAVSSCAPSTFISSSNNSIPPGGSYHRSVSYGLFCSAHSNIEFGSLITNINGVIQDLDEYRSNNINQYKRLGMPKPSVFFLPPPLNLALDCRSWGNKARFIRSGCHPNAVIRPVILRQPDAPPTLSFGVFAIQEIQKKEEILIGWQLDDGHLLHQIVPIMANPPPEFMIGASVTTTAIPRATKNIPSAQVNIKPKLIQHFQEFMANFLGLMSCPCENRKLCTMIQVQRLLEGKGLLGVTAKLGKKPRKFDMGPIFGSVRGWNVKVVPLSGPMQEHLDNKDEAKTVRPKIVHRRSGSDSEDSRKRRAFSPGRRVSDGPSAHGTPKSAVPRLPSGSVNEPAMQTPVLESASKGVKTPEATNVALPSLQASPMAIAESKEPSPAPKQRMSLAEFRALAAKKREAAQAAQSG